MKVYAVMAAVLILPTIFAVNQRREDKERRFSESENARVRDEYRRLGATTAVAEQQRLIRAQQAEIIRSTDAYFAK